MNYVYSFTQHKTAFSYQPIPFYNDTESSPAFNTKLDLNLYCIKKPQKTCFIRVTNPNLIAWGIEAGDMLVVEKNEKLFLNDLVVIEVSNKFQIYELIAQNNDEFIFMNLDSKGESIKTKELSKLTIIGTITNTIHQIKPQQNNRMKFAS
ncbi:S24 family peptidase [Rodentibacter caecimuris]|uniref:Type VI secretion protein ImpA n=1 Tax=Rodentibacter caecimuris TaxID=1796644 RepID=A0ABX3KXX1_9PAST|nr:type VI secretion protein ImpA [Rodentibacter heylii]